MAHSMTTYTRACLYISKGHGPSPATPLTPKIDLCLSKRSHLKFLLDTHLINLLIHCLQLLEKGFNDIEKPTTSNAEGRRESEEAKFYLLLFSIM